MQISKEKDEPERCRGGLEKRLANLWSGRKLAKKSYAGRG
jgi:hypothetical protein